MSMTPESARSVPSDVLEADFAAIVGAKHLRAATPADAVDGVQPQLVAEPADAEELARVLQRATAAGLRVAPRGGGTKLGWGNRPAGVDLVISTLRLNRVLEHAWSDMTATVEAGCTVENFQRTLAEHGQRLALDPLWPEGATIGGILATNDSGSLRIRFGALRDLIIGITLALSDGTLAKSGGKVVKNVAGYDMMKLATGSLGTLGVITQAVFRLYPLPRTARSMTFSAPDTAALNRLVLAVLDSQMAPTGLQMRVGSDESPHLDVRFESTPAGIEAQTRQMRELAAGLKEVERTTEVWNARERLWRDSDGAVIAKFSVLPSQLSEFCARAQETAMRDKNSQLEWQVVAQGFGVGWARIRAQNAAPLLPAISLLRKHAEQMGGSLVVSHCPPQIKSHLDVWGATGDALPLMVRIKQQLDPTGTINPGRFVGGI